MSKQRTALPGADAIAATPPAHALTAPAVSGRQVYSVTQLNHEVRGLIEDSFPLLWVEGELSNLARPASGHLYFSLKDGGAQVRCAMFRRHNLHLGFSPTNGQQVLVRGRVGLYEPRGEYQFIVEHIEGAGDGALRRAFEILKQRLDQEGLFDAGRKRALPTLPRRIGVVTSHSGAAIRDIITTLRRRFPTLPIIVYPVAVQGAGAGAQIAAAITQAGRRTECDVLIVARGGGSLEDLWAFNEEGVARAIYTSPIPVVTGIGHEIDFTIADFVADQRAPTPTGAAELVSPDQTAWHAHFAQLAQRLNWRLRDRLAQAHRHLDGLGKRLRHPGRRLQDIGQRLDELELRLLRGQRTVSRHAEAQLQALALRVARYNPGERMARHQSRQRELASRLGKAAQRLFAARQQQLGTLVRTLDTLSPLATLTRGYAIIRRPADGRVLHRAAEARRGETLEAQLSEGWLVCEIKDIRDS